MLRIVLLRPGSTDFDEQGRIKGTLNIPLNEHGNQQVAQAADALEGEHIERVYASPCCSARQSAERLGADLRIKVKVVDELTNLNHGLWHGKLIEDVKHKQPRVYRQWQDQPETVCPPEGETVAAAMARISRFLRKLLKKHPRGVLALVVPEPLASMVSSVLHHDELGDLWQAECDHGTWELIDIESPRELLV
jgi:broad specificity phosphatase PhoE